MATRTNDDSKPDATTPDENTSRTAAVGAAVTDAAETARNAASEAVAQASRRRRDDALGDRGCQSPDASRQ